MIWFKRTRGLDSSIMRQIAEDAGVPWSSESIVYRGDDIGFKDGGTEDVTAIQDAAENLLGYRPVEIDEPPKPEPTQE